VANNQLTNAGLLGITKLAKLTELDLSGNSQITDLTALVVLTNLKKINVGDNKSLKQQIEILTSGASLETKRSQLVTSKISEVQVLAEGNVGDLQTLKDSVATSVQTLKQYNENLEERIAELENKLSQLNQACFAGQTSQGQQKPKFNVDAPPKNDADSFKPGVRRRLAGDCLKGTDAVRVSLASAAGLISVAAATVAAVLL